MSVRLITSSSRKFSSRPDQPHVTWSSGGGRRRYGIVSPGKTSQKRPASADRFLDLDGVVTGGDNDDFEMESLLSPTVSGPVVFSKW